MNSLVQTAEQMYDKAFDIKETYKRQSRKAEQVCKQMYRTMMTFKATSE
jgi:hypothetical protein